IAAWTLGASLTGFPGDDFPRLFAAMGVALFEAGVLWLTYLALEPYVRRHAPDSLIGWSSIMAGQWRDPRVGADVMIGLGAGLLMTLFYAVHNLLPVLAGQPEPMPLVPATQPLLGARHAMASILQRTSEALSAAMLATVGIVALQMWLKRAWLAGLVGAVVFTPVVIDGMFPEGT